jgi:hypothetical protein
MKDVLTPAPARWNLAQALAGGGNDGVGDSRHDVDFQLSPQIELMNLVCPNEAI